MKVNRAQIVLHMLFLIKEQSFFTEEEVLKGLGVSRSSFFRGLNEIREYLQIHRPETELIFHKKSARYYLATIHNQDN